MVVLNPILANQVLEKAEFMLVDEIDLYLPPQWQQIILVAFHIIFQEVQFIVSALAINTVPRRNCRLKSKCAYRIKRREIPIRICNSCMQNLGKYLEVFLQEESVESERITTIMVKREYGF